jgi:hypothetical protein
MKASLLNAIYSLTVSLICYSASVAASENAASENAEFVHVTKLNKDNFDSFVKANGPNLVEFFAPCKTNL